MIPVQSPASRAARESRPRRAARYAAAVETDRYREPRDGRRDGGLSRSKSRGCERCARDEHDDADEQATGDAVATAGDRAWPGSPDESQGDQPVRDDKRDAERGRAARVDDAVAARRRVRRDLVLAVEREQRGPRCRSRESRTATAWSARRAAAGGARRARSRRRIARGQGGHRRAQVPRSWQDPRRAGLPVTIYERPRARNGRHRDVPPSPATSVDTHEVPRSRIAPDRCR